MIGTLQRADDHTPLEGIPAFFQAPPPSRFKSHIETNDSQSGSEVERLNDPDAAGEENNEFDESGREDVDTIGGDVNVAAGFQSPPTLL